MKKVRDMFVKVQDVELLTPTGMFMVSANTIYNDEFPGTPCQFKNARELVEGILSAARQAGVCHTAKLGRLMRTDRLNYTALQLAQHACDAIPSWRMNKLLLKSHREAEAGAPLYPAHGLLDFFVGAENRIIKVPADDVATNPPAIEHGQLNS